ncbi:MAG: ABC transporter ATP-binding protein [Acidaminococcaceae bacterium]
MGVINANNIIVKLTDKTILQGITLDIPKGKVTAIIGPNGCGKSTTLKALARIIPCISGNITYDGKDIKVFSHKEFAKRLAILTQSPQSPPDLTVKDLVELGRFPHRSWWKRNTEEDEQCVEWALKQASMRHMRNRLLSTLSGGERQRAWIAMALAQKPQVLLLDEPTTYLDISHQLEVMKLLKKLNNELGLTVVMVLHDINHALHYSDHIAVMKKGEVVAAGEPHATINSDLLRDVFRVKVDSFVGSNGLPALLPIDLVYEQSQ